MLLANALMGKEDVSVRMLFDNDLRGEHAPFGIQNVAEIGLKEFGVFPGQWYGINCMSLVMESLNRKFTPVSNFNICTFQDGNINFFKIAAAGCKDLKLNLSYSIIDTSQVNKPSVWQNWVLVIVANRFGIKNVATEYYPAIKRFMKLPSFVGLIGGKPNSAYYFCGLIEAPTEHLTESVEPIDQLLFLDPHIVRASSDTNSCSDPKTLQMSELDPCMSFGFLVKSEKEFLQLQKQLREGI